MLPVVKPFRLPFEPIAIFDGTTPRGWPSRAARPSVTLTVQRELAVFCTSLSSTTTLHFPFLPRFLFGSALATIVGGGRKTWTPCVRSKLSKTRCAAAGATQKAQTKSVEKTANDLICSSGLLVSF